MCTGVEDLSSGVMLPEPDDGWGWFVVGSVSSYPTHPDGLHFHLPVPVQHSSGVPLLSRRQQGGKGRYAAIFVFICIFNTKS